MASIFVTALLRIGIGNIQISIRSTLPHRNRRGLGAEGSGVSQGIRDEGFLDGSFSPEHAEPATTPLADDGVLGESAAAITALHQLIVASRGDGDDRVLDVLEEGLHVCALAREGLVDDAKLGLVEAGLDAGGDDLAHAVSDLAYGGGDHLEDVGLCEDGSCRDRLGESPFEDGERAEDGVVKQLVDDVDSNTRLIDPVLHDGGDYLAAGVWRFRADGQKTVFAPFDA